jgi:hypothetical protein
MRRHRFNAVTRILGRLVLWLAIALLLVRGALDVVSGSAPAIAELGRKQPGNVQVNEREAAAFATAFARAYLTYAPKDPERHAIAVEPYASSWLGAHAGLELPAVGRAQRVVDAQPARVVRLEPRQLLVTVAVQLQPPRPAPLYLTVPVAGSSTGALAVVSYPSFAPGPRRALFPEPQPHPLDAAQRAPVEDLLRRFFPLYLSGRSGELAYFLPAGRRLDALASPYAFVELVRAEIAAPMRGRRAIVVARLRARDEQTQATYLLAYRLELELRERWYVAAINTA